MRPVNPPRLKWRKPRPDKHQGGVWVIFDRGREISTGAGQSQREIAEIKLAEYITQTRKPEFGNGDPSKVMIGDCLAFYADSKKLKLSTAPKRAASLASDIDRLADFFGDKPVSTITPTLCDGYVEWRTAQRSRRVKNDNGKPIAVSTARRELVTLIAACNYCYDNKKLDRPPNGFKLPPVGEPRERFLTRGELARLLLGALGWDHKTGKRNHSRINRHLARFILIGYYTGTRHDAMLRLGWLPSTFGGWFDLENRVLY